jgi:hypothetical protein
VFRLVWTAFGYIICELSRLTIAFEDLHKSKGKRINIDSSEQCGLRLHKTGEPGRYDSGLVQLALPADILQPMWVSTVPNANLTIRVASSHDKRHWSEWLVVSDEVQPAKVPPSSVGKPLKDLGGVRFLRYQLEIKPESNGELHGCVDVVMFMYTRTGHTGNSTP